MYQSRLTPQPEPLGRVIWRNRWPVALATACYGASAVITACAIVPVLRLACAGILTAWVLVGGQ